MFWKRVLVALSIVAVVYGPISWFVESVTPSWIVFPILVVVGLVRARRGGTSGAVWLGVSALIFLIVHLPFDKAALSDHCVNPADKAKDCHPLLWLLTLGALPLLMVVTSALTFREAGGVWRLPRLRRS